MVRKTLKRGAQAAIGLTVALEVALLNLPDLVSSPLEEYMQENDIPLEIVEGMKTDGMRVYHEHGHLSALHLSALLFTNNAKNFDFLWAIVEPLRALPSVYGDMASLHASHGDCMIFMPDKDQTIDDLISKTTGIPEFDLELTEKLRNTFKANILVHEVAHGQPMERFNQEYCVQEHGTAVDSSGSSELYSELRSDDASLDLMKDADVTDYMISYRAVTAFNHLHDISHDTAIYIDEWYNKDSLSLRGEMPDHLDYKNDFAQVFSPYVEKYSSEEPAPYQLYKAALEFLDDHADTGKVRESSQRMVELYVRGVEYFAPTKSEELRAMRNSLNLKSDSSPVVF